MIAYAAEKSFVRALSNEVYNPNYD